MNVEEVRTVLTRLRNNFVEFVFREHLPFNPETLACACGVCSYMVFVTLRNMGLKPVFHMNDCHCFVTCGGYWIDLTLKQFFPHVDEVFFYDHPYRIECAYGFVHRSENRATTELQIRRLFAEWPEEQNPFKQKLPKILQQAA